MSMMMMVMMITKFCYTIVATCGWSQFHVTAWPFDPVVHRGTHTGPLANPCPFIRWHVFARCPLEWQKPSRWLWPCAVMWTYTFCSDPRKHDDRTSHSNYQIGPNRCKLDQIGDAHYHIWTLCPQLHHCTCIRSMFSLINNTNTEYTSAELIEHCYRILLRLISNFSSYLNDWIYHKVIYEFW